MIRYSIRGCSAIDVLYGADRQSYPRFCGSVIFLRATGPGGPCVAGRYPASAVPLRRERTRKPVPPALLPLEPSPSRAHRWTRWWALTPPFHPLPFRAGLFSVAVVVASRSLRWRPRLRFRGARLPGSPAGSREVPLRISLPPAHLSDGSCLSARIYDFTWHRPGSQPRP